LISILCRWCHHLDPSVKKTSFSAEEDSLILDIHSRMGNRWADIARMLPGRTENSVKIRFKSLQRRIRSQEIEKIAAIPTDDEVHSAFIELAPLEVELLYESQFQIDDDLSSESTDQSFYDEFIFDSFFDHVNASDFYSDETEFVDIQSSSKRQRFF